MSMAAIARAGPLRRALQRLSLSLAMPERARLLAEAEALDRVLERAPLPSLAIEAALAERIVAAAQRSPRIVKIPTGQSSVISLPGSEVLPQQRAGSWKRQFLRGDVRAAAVLAASLVVGIFIGISNVPQSVLPGLADLAGDRGGYSLAQVEPFDEDVL